MNRTSRRGNGMPADSGDTLLLAKIRFIEEWEGGMRPTAQQFVRRYPECADELLDFILAYTAAERAVATVPDTAPTSMSARALERATAAIASRTGPGPADAAPPQSLLEVAKGAGIPMQKIAQALNLSNQAILRVLRGQVIAPPRHLVQVLADTLGRAADEVASLISLPMTAGNLMAGHHRIVGGAPKVVPAIRQISFSQLLEETTDLTEEQRCFWLEVMAREEQA